MCAWKKEGCAPEDYTGAARREALRMKEDIASVIG
jgi:orotidine-5'-phosphate decarboxylase